MLNLKQYFQKAQKEGWAIGQFNFSSLEILKGIIRAAEELESPVILGTSEGESEFFGLEEAVAMVNVYRRKTKLPLFLNLDHGKNLDYIRKAINAGYDAVQFDGSTLSLEENIALTKKVKEYAEKSEVVLEGEVGMIGTVSDEKRLLTDPDEALKFIKETRVDSLAISIGSLHGMKEGKGGENLDFNRLNNIKSKLKDFPLVLHGASGVVPENIKAVILAGIVKINISTELRLAFRNALNQSFVQMPKEVKPYKFLSGGIMAVQEIVKEKINLLGSRSHG